MPIALSLILAAAAAAPDSGALRGKVHAEGRHEGPLVVYIEHLGQPEAAPSARPELAQKGQDFEPRALVVEKGQVVQFPNYDKVYHNVFSLSAGNEFDLGLYRAGPGKTVEMKAPGEVVVYCNIHPDMVAKVLVLENHFHAQVAEDGSYAIEGIPPGRYTAVAWSAVHEPQRLAVEVKPRAAAQADFSLALRSGDRSHLNKDGAQYGRYR